MEPFGSERGPMISITNIKVAKNIKLWESMKLQLNFQVFNLFNTSGATSTSYLTGANVPAPDGHRFSTCRAHRNAVFFLKEEMPGRNSGDSRPAV